MWVLEAVCFPGCGLCSNSKCCRHIRMERGELLLTDLLMNNDKLSEGAYSVSLSENICH